MITIQLTPEELDSVRYALRELCQRRREQAIEATNPDHREANGREANGRDILAQRNAALLAALIAVEKQYLPTPLMIQVRNALAQAGVKL